MRIGITAILRLAAVGLLSVAVIAFIAGCSSSGDGDDGATTGDEVAEHVEGDEHADDEHADDEHVEGDGHEDDHADAASSVHVSLNEWSITPAHGDSFGAASGDVVFEIHNEGAAPHDLKIVKTDLAPDALPVTDGVVDTESSGEVIGGVDPLPGDIMVEETHHLEAGHYVLICTIPGHYQQGMFAEMTVE